MRFRYSRWDGTQDPFGPDIAAADVLEQLRDEILMGGSADAPSSGCCGEGCRAGSPGWTP